MFSPGGLLLPLSFPKEILGGGSRAPAEETEVGAGAAVSEAVPPWPPELPAPPWPPELPAPPWPPELPAPPWPPELPAPPGPLSVCSTLEAPSCVCICVGPVGSPEWGVMLEVFRVCLVFPPLVSVYGSFHVIMSSFVPGVCNL